MVTQLDHFKNIHLRQVQKHKIDAYMHQSLSVLQMSFFDLIKFLDEKKNENPLLELEPTSGFDDNDHLFEPIHFKTIYGSSLDNSSVNYNEDESFFFDYDSENISDSVLFSIKDVLIEQLLSLFLTDDQFNLCLYLVDCLNERGYLDVSTIDISNELGISEFHVLQSLYILQSLNPCGVGARSLSECLMIQLSQNEDFCPETIRIVKDGLPYLAKNDMMGLSKLVGCSLSKVYQFADSVRKLNPIPSQGYFSGEPTHYIIPDATIKKDSNGLYILLNKGIGTKVELNSDYSDIFKDSFDEKTRSYLKKKHAEARALMSAVENRNKTLECVINCIVVLQYNYFNGENTIYPMTLRDVASYLGIHVSTVSRTIKNKYVKCNAGTISLKSLFSCAASSSFNINISSIFVKQKISFLIQSENKNRPLSDESLKDALEAMGIKVSRRTIAKYRDSLEIPKSSIRKKMSDKD